MSGSRALLRKSFPGLVLVLAMAAVVDGSSQWQGREQREGGPAPLFRTEAPESDLNVIAGSPTSNSVVLSVLSRSSGTVLLKYRSAADSKAGVVQRSLSLTAGQPSEIEIVGLNPGRRYTYTLLGTGKTGIEGSFATAPPPSKKFTFDIQADSHLDGNSDLATYERTLRQIVADQPDFLIDLGDTFMVDKYPQYRDSLKQYEAQRTWLSIPGQEMAVFLCLGNHDGEYGWRQRGGPEVSEWSRSQRERLFPSPRSGYYTGVPKRGLYYSWQWGDALFVVLDPFVATTRKPRDGDEGWNWTLGQAQHEWFQRTLAQSKSRYKFVFIHHLVGGFGKEARGGAEASAQFEWGDRATLPAQRPGWAEPIHDMMVKNRVSAVFHGHDHLYARQERDGILYLEVPQPSFGRGDSSQSAHEYGYSAGKILGGSGHIRVTVDPNAAKVEYVKSQPGESSREVADSCILTTKL